MCPSCRSSPSSPITCRPTSLKPLQRNRFRSEDLMPRYLPICLSVESRRCLIVGGGAVAARRVRYLFEAGALVKVVAPKVCEEILRLSAEGIADVALESYSPDHVAESVLVFACTDSAEV